MEANGNFKVTINLKALVVIIIRPFKNIFISYHRCEITPIEGFVNEFCSNYNS